MRRFSRWMPPVPRRPVSFVGWLVLAGLVAALVTVSIWRPLGTFLVLAAIAGVSAVLEVRRARRLRGLAAARAGEDIGTFARAFDRRGATFDPWVIRAVWEALQPHARFRGGRLPLRPGDRLDVDLAIDPEDLDEIALEVAARVGRQATGWEKNPLYGRVQTVGDLVELIANQPREAAA